MLRILLVLVAVGLSAPANAQETRTLAVKKALFCNTEMELQTLLTQISLNNGDIPDDAPAGCGMFSPRSRVLMDVTPLYWYDTPFAKALISTFVFTPNGWTQYGYIAFKLHPKIASEPT